MSIKDIVESACCWIGCSAVIVVSIIVMKQDWDIWFLLLPAIYTYKVRNLNNK